MECIVNRRFITSPFSKNFNSIKFWCQIGTSQEDWSRDCPNRSGLGITDYFSFCPTFLSCPSFLWAAVCKFINSMLTAKCFFRLWSFVFVVFSPPAPQTNRITACRMFTKLKFFSCSIICQPLLLSLSASLDRISGIIRGFLRHISNYILGHSHIVSSFLCTLIASCRAIRIFGIYFLKQRKLIRRWMKTFMISLNSL